MPVHEIRYRAYEGTLRPISSRLFVIPKFTLMTIFNKWVATAIFGPGAVGLLGLTVYLLITNNEVVASYFPMFKNTELISAPKLLMGYFIFQFYVALVPLVLAGPKLISPELQHKALPILFSRPITRTRYIIGKCAAIGTFFSFLTWFQGLLLFLMMVAIYQKETPFYTNFFPDTVKLFAGILFAGALTTVFLSLLAASTSAASKNWRYAAVVLLVVIIGSESVSGILLSNVDTDSIAFGVVSLMMAAFQHIFGVTESLILTAKQVVFGLTFWTIISTAFLYWRLKPVEVFKE